MSYTVPYSQQELNFLNTRYHPTSEKEFDNLSFQYWSRSLFQRLLSVFDINSSLFEEDDRRKAMFEAWLFGLGAVAVIAPISTGTIVQPFNYGGGRDIYYQPTDIIVSNPYLSLGNNRFIIGEDCSLIRCTPDSCGVMDIISYWASKLALLTASLDMNIINSKYSKILTASNKSGADALKIIYDKIQRGESAVVVDRKVSVDAGQETWQQFYESPNLRNSYLVPDILVDIQTIINSFDAEIGIPTVPYQKKERLVVDEANSKQADGTARSQVWYDTISADIEKVNSMFPDANFTIELRSQQDNDIELESTESEGDENEL